MTAISFISLQYFQYTQLVVNWGWHCGDFMCNYHVPLYTRLQPRVVYYCNMVEWSWWDSSLSARL